MELNKYNLDIHFIYTHTELMIIRIRQVGYNMEEI